MIEERSHFQTILVWLVLVLALIEFCPGCTVVKLATDQQGTDLSQIQPGLTRIEAEDLLGPPLREWNSSSGVTYRTYRYDAGRPSNFSLAAAWAVMDLITFGVMEIVGTQASDPHLSARVVISYDDQDVILGVFDEFDDLPPDGRSGPRQWKR